MVKGRSRRLESEGEKDIPKAGFSRGRKASASHPFSPGRWDLDDLISGGRGDLQKTLSGIQKKVTEFETDKTRLADFGKQEVAGALHRYESIMEDLAIITAKPQMEYSTDTGDGKVKASLDRAEDLDVDIENRLLFFQLWWIALDDSRSALLTPDDADLRYFLTLWRKQKPHTLEERVEQAINLKNVTGFSGWTHHYDKIVSDFTFVLKVKNRTLKDAAGKPRKFVAEEVVRLAYSPDPSTREAAYKALLGKYAEHGDVLGEVYRTIVRDWRNEYVKLRGYESAISPRNLGNQVTDATVQTLLRVCRENGPVFQEFFEVKSKLVGMKKMSRYHIYAPLVKKERSVSYADAVRKVISAFERFDPKFARLAVRVFEANHVDSSPRKGKESGAYCYSVTPHVVPYLFLNFSGVNRDIETIAHESGHAIHSQLATSHSLLTFHPPLVLAETASVFGEMLLFDNNLREEKNKEIKRGMLMDKISSVYATIGRQAYFVVFEEEAHRTVNEGATVSDLCALYLRNLREQFGEAVQVPDEFKWEWTYIPHIYHTPFYCYAYSFGNLLTLALYDTYLREGKSFVPRYMRLLSYGGSKNPEDILTEMGVDVSSPRFWQGGFNVIRRMVKDLQTL